MITDALVLYQTSQVDEVKLLAKKQWLSTQGVTRVILRALDGTPAGGGAAIKSIEEEGFEGSFYVVTLEAPEIDLPPLATAHTESWSTATQATDAGGKKIGIYLFEFRVFDYLTRGEACELDELFVKLKEQDEAVLEVVA